MKKKVFRILAWLVPILVFSFLFFDSESFLRPFLTLGERIQAGQWFHRYAFENAPLWDEINVKIDSTVDQVVEFVVEAPKFDLSVFLMDLINGIYDFLLYTLDYGLNIILILYCFVWVFLNREVPDVKYTPSARFLNSVFVFFGKAKKSFRNLLQFVFRKHKKEVWFSILIFTFFQGWLFTLLSETGIFFGYYLTSAARLDTHIILFSIIQSILIFFVFDCPFWITVSLLIYLFWRWSFNSAEKKMEKNYQKLKAFEKFETSCFNGINGFSSAGKTESAVALALAAEENYIDEIEEILHGIEIDHPDVNFGELERDLVQLVSKYPEYFFFKSLLYEFDPDCPDDCRSMIASAPVSIKDPFTGDQCSVILDYNWIRPNVIMKEFPFEEYKVLILDELDKEYNSHYSKEEVGEDGFYRFIGAGPHWFKRHIKVYATWQIESQVPLNVRGNFGLILKIVDRKEKYPFLLGLWMAPFRWLFEFFDSALQKYESYKPRLAKDTRRRGTKVRKRFDYTFFYSLIRRFVLSLSGILEWFSKYRYIVLYYEQNSVDGKTVLGRYKLPINRQDEVWKGSRLYDSTYLSQGYDFKHSRSERFWKKLDRYQSIYPSMSELEKTNMRFINETILEKGSVSSGSSSNDDSGSPVVECRF